VTAAVPHWPGRMLTLAREEQVWVAETPAVGRDLVL
jgi:hypothetical protein